MIVDPRARLALDDAARLRIVPTFAPSRPAPGYTVTWGVGWSMDRVVALVLRVLKDMS